MKKIDYDEVIKLGFKRENCNDDVFFRTYGYDWFIVQLKCKDIVFDWDSTTMQVQMIRYDSKKESANRVATLKIETLEMLKLLVDFYTCKTNETFKLPKQDVITVC